METTNTIKLNLTVVAVGFPCNRTNHSLDKKNNFYATPSLVDDGAAQLKKYKTDIEKDGNKYVLLTNANANSAALHIEVFSRRMLLPDKRVGELRVLVSELAMLATGDDNHETVATRQLVSSSKSKKPKGLLNFSYKLSIDGYDFPAALRRHEASL